MAESQIGADDSHALGWLMIVFDSFFLIGSLFSMLAIVWLLRVKLKEVVEETVDSTGSTSEMDFKSTKVMPK